MLMIVRNKAENFKKVVAHSTIRLLSINVWWFDSSCSKHLLVLWKKYKIPYGTFLQNRKQLESYIVIDNYNLPKAEIYLG